MERGVAKSRGALGFLTVVEHPQHGLFGGYLVLNTSARPLEFHCTAPIKPNRAQQILYGPTLEPFLYGEQIGHTLLARARTQPWVVCTDCPPVLAVREHVQTPVVLVLAEGPQEGSGFEVQGSGTTEPQVPSSPISTRDSVWRVDTAHHGGPLIGFQLGRNRLAVAQSCQQDRRLLAERIAGLAESFDLAEPFGRIRDAIEEARRGGQSG